jgi:hypothetical protein
MPHVNGNLAAVSVGKSPALAVKSSVYGHVVGHVNYDAYTYIICSVKRLKYYG